MLDYLEREKGIKRDILVEAISTAILAASKKTFTSGTRELRIEINPQSGAIKAIAKLIVAEKPANAHEEISVAKARSIKPDVQPGEEIDVEVTPKDFGRIAAQAARQAINQRLRQIEREMIYEEFKDRTGDIVTGTVSRFDRSDVIVDLGKFEGVMPNRERVMTEEYNVGDKLRAYVVAVESGSRGPEIILSRSHPNFVRRLFEAEVNEISDRTVEIRGIAREAGFRTKVAVWSSDPKVDPVGACVGMRGARVKNIVRELNNEKVDIIRWSEDPKEFVREALKPAELRSISVDEENKIVHVTVDEIDLSKAIGRKGQNARLSSRLMGWDVQVRRDESKEEQFRDRIGGAAHTLGEQLGISDELANKLTLAGGIAPEYIVGMSVDDIAEAVGISHEEAAPILARAQAIVAGEAADAGV